MSRSFKNNSHLGWKFHSIGFLISKFGFSRPKTAPKFKFANKKSNGMEFPSQIRIIFKTSTRDPSLEHFWIFFCRKERVVVVLFCLFLYTSLIYKSSAKNRCEEEQLLTMLMVLVLLLPTKSTMVLCTKSSL